VVCSHLGAHLFVKIPRPGDSEGTFLDFKISCQLVISPQIIRCYSMVSKLLVSILAITTSCGLLG